MNKTILSFAIFSTAMLLGAADLRIATAQIRAAKDENTLNSTLSEVLKQTENDNDKASLLIDGAIKARDMKLFVLSEKLFANVVALPQAAAPIKARAMEQQAWLLINRLNNRAKGVEVYKKILALNVPGYEHKINYALGHTIYYGGKGFKRSDAIVYFEATLKYPNNNGMFFVVRDRIERKKLAEAREVLEKAKKQANPSRNFLYDLCNAEGELLCAEGKYEESLATYDKLDKLEPKRHSTHLWYKYSVYRAAKNKAKAVETLKEMLKYPGWEKAANNELKYWEKVK